MLGKRILTAVLLAPPFFGILWWGNDVALFFLFFFLAMMCYLEYFSMVIKEGWLMRAFLVVAGLMPLFFGLVGRYQYYGLWMCIYILLSTFLVVFTYSSWERPMNALAATFFGFNYVGAFFFHILLLKTLPGGREWIIFLFLTVFSGDIFAYFSGMLFGRRRLCPAISPKKTWEGAFGGLLASLVAGAMWLNLFLPGLNIYWMALLPIVVGALAQVGDLLESVLKRSFGVKDASGFLPGHGGFLDRFDGAIFSAPFLYWCLRIL